MKKILYIILFVFVISATFSACTEENVSPRTDDAVVGGGSQDPKG